MAIEQSRAIEVKNIHCHSLSLDAWRMSLTENNFEIFIAQNLDEQGWKCNGCRNLVRESFEIRALSCEL
jgi:hypothetical protein